MVCIVRSPSKKGNWRMSQLPFLWWILWCFCDGFLGGFLDAFVTLSAVFQVVLGGASLAAL